MGGERVSETRMFINDQGVCFAKSLRPVFEVEKSFWFIGQSFLEKYKKHRSSKNSPFKLELTQSKKLSLGGEGRVKAPDVKEKGAFCLCSLAAGSVIPHESVYVRCGKVWYVLEQTSEYKIWAVANDAPRPNGAYVVVNVE